MTTTTTARPAEVAAAAELDNILRTHRAQLFGHLARHAAHHNLNARDVAELLDEHRDTVRDWLLWAAEGPACTCAPSVDGSVTEQQFDCPAHGDLLYRNQVRNRLIAA